MFRITYNIIKIKKVVADYVIDTEREQREKNFTGLPSCLYEVKEMVNQYLDDYKNDQLLNEKLSENQIDKIAHTALHTVLWNGVSSGRYHIYTGLLTPVGKRMHEILMINLERSIEAGYVLREDKDKYIENIKTNIDYVG